MRGQIGPVLQRSGAQTGDWTSNIFSEPQSCCAERADTYDTNRHVRSCETTRGSENSTANWSHARDLLSEILDHPSDGMPPLHRSLEVEVEDALGDVRPLSVHYSSTKVGIPPVVCGKHE